MSAPDNRRRKRCNAGHEFTTANTLWRNSRRVCLMCSAAEEPADAKRRAQARAWYHRNKTLMKQKFSAYIATVQAEESARTKVNNAVRSGNLLRQPCAVCGNPKSQGHHEDYSKPLDVVWLCRKHHARRHREIDAQQPVTK